MASRPGGRLSSATALHDDAILGSVCPFRGGGGQVRPLEKVPATGRSIVVILGRWKFPAWWRLGTEEGRLPCTIWQARLIRAGGPQLAAIRNG